MNHLRPIIAFIFLLFASCTIPSGITVQGMAEEQVPSYPTHEQTALLLDDVAQSVGKLTSVAFYITYHFDRRMKITPSHISDSILQTVKKNSVLSTQSVSGTAWVGYKDQDIIGFVTAAHVVVFKDTLFGFFTARQRYLHSISIKIKQKNYITDIANSGEAYVVAYDSHKDIALLKKTVDPDRERPPLLDIPTMQANAITWGMPLYILGFPHGRLLLTQAVATKPAGNNKNFFSNDAVFNRGMSGAPVIASTSKPPYFYLAGIVSSASVEKINYLEPLFDKNLKETNGVPYEGKPVTNSLNLIQYGMTQAATMNSFISFVRQNRAHMANNGFSTDSFVH